MESQVIRCDKCGRPLVDRRPSYLRRSERHFCDSACYRQYQQADETTVWDRIEKTETCWLWRGSCTAGYGQVKFRGKHWEVHRLVWTLLRGPIPDGIYVLHDCPGGDNKLCCNPDHLWLGTNSDNMLDALAKGQMSALPLLRGEAQPRHRLSERQVTEIRCLTTETHAALGRRFGVSAQTISDIRRGRIWRHLIARDQHGLSEAQVEERCMSQFGCLPSELSKKAASEFITSLKR